jgi:hypothetical protein
LRTSKLEVAYNREKDADVKERILLIRRIVEDKKHIEDVAKELQIQSMGLQVVQKI